MKTIFLALISLMLLGSGLSYAGTYLESAHGHASSGVDRATIDSDYGDYTPGNCAHCHEAHASLDGSEPTPTGGPDEVLLFDYEEDLCETCHDGNPAADDIKTQMGKTSAHPTHASSGRHSVSESTTTNMDPNDYADDQSARHAECVDCHNPHAAESDGHEMGTNAVTLTSPIYKVSGIGASNPTAWTAPSYTEIPTSTGISYEYELCFKCHSTWTDQPGTQTNIAMQFNTANPSAHPVKVGLTASSSSALSAAQMTDDWNDNMGTQTMYCSDCHGDDASDTPPKGPHGSGIGKILKGHWPIDPSDSNPWTLGDANTTNFNNNCLCRKCHPVRDGSGWRNNAHSESRHSTYKCVECHVGLPHGYHYSGSGATMQGRLIAHADDSAPYNYGGYAEVTYFRKQSRNSYDDGDCDVDTCSSRRH